MAKKPQVRQAPNVISMSRVDIDPNPFDVAVYQKGKNVIWESAVKCPCKSDGRGNLGTCVNCGGMGWVYINPIKTKMIIQSMNLGSKYNNWSLERVGMANITTRYLDIVGDMDKITLEDSLSKFSQIIMPKLFKSELFGFTHYPISSVVEVFAFKSGDSKLIKIEPSKYSFSGNRIMFNKNLYKEDFTVSVRYTHKIQYYIIDLVREVRESTILDIGKPDAITKLPASSVGRRCHYVINPDNFTEASVVDNSYEEIPKKPYIVTDKR